MAFDQSPHEYSGQWPEIFKTESKLISAAHPGSIGSIEHIGSTSVAGLMAKPIIDILIELKNGRLDSLVDPLTKLGYTSKGENGIDGRSYFSRNDGVAVHIHCFQEGHAELKKHLSLRDYLRAHSQVKKEYEEFKKRILSNPEITRHEYQQQKDHFLSETSREAVLWSDGRPPKEKIVSKVVIYAFRRRNLKTEVLVFDHLKYPEVSPQVPSGTVEQGEDISIAAKREFFEESGVEADTEMAFLGSYVYFKIQNQQFQERNIFALNGVDLPEEWTHNVSGIGEDKDFLFKYHWLPIDRAINELKGNFGDGLSYFKSEIKVLI